MICGRSLRICIQYPGSLLSVTLPVCRQRNRLYIHIRCHQVNRPRSSTTYVTFPLDRGVTCPCMSTPPSESICFQMVCLQITPRCHAPAGFCQGSALHHYMPTRQPVSCVQCHPQPSFRCQLGEAADSPLERSARLFSICGHALRYLAIRQCQHTCAAMTMKSEGDSRVRFMRTSRVRAATATLTCHPKSPHLPHTHTHTWVSGAHSRRGSQRACHSLCRAPPFAQI